MSFAGAIEGLRTSRQTRRSSQMLMEIVSGISRAPDRADLMGLRPDDQRDAKLVECKAQVASKSVWQNTAVVLRRFWMYFFLENLYTVVPLIMALVPVLAGGALANELITAMPTHAGAYDGFEELTAEHTAQVKSFAYLQAVVTPVGLYGMPAALSCTLWSWRTLLKPVLLKLVLPGFLVSLAFGLVNVSLLYDGDATLEKYSLYFQIFLLAFFLAPALVRAGNVTKNPLFGWLAMPALLMCMCMVAGHCSTVKSAPPFAGAQRDTERESSPHVPPQRSPGGSAACNTLPKGAGPPAAHRTSDAQASKPPPKSLIARASFGHPTRYNIIFTRLLTAPNWTKACFPSAPLPPPLPPSPSTTPPQ